MRILVNIVVCVVGGALGAVGGYFFDNKSDLEERHLPSAPHEMAIGSQVETEFDYFRLNSQFVIPVVAEGKIKSLVALSLSLELKKASGDIVFSREPKLRDAFLRVLFDHANAGGFDGEFTTSGNLVALRRSLAEAGRQVVGASIIDVLITDIARQDS